MVGIGDRIAAYRRRRGLSQVTLAGLVGRSESWLSQVERGRRGIDSLSVIRDLDTAAQPSTGAPGKS
jgi:transcriptional regulator with XRE-family HTH domain